MSEVQGCAPLSQHDGYLVVVTACIGSHMLTVGLHKVQVHLLGAAGYHAAKEELTGLTQAVSLNTN